MGARGPGAGKLRQVAAAYDEAAHTAQPWDKEGMPEAERVIAFLESLPVVSGLKAGGHLELLDFQKQFVRGVYGPRTDADERLVRLGTGHPRQRARRSIHYPIAGGHSGTLQRAGHCL